MKKLVWMSFVCASFLKEACCEINLDKVDFNFPNMTMSVSGLYNPHTGSDPSGLKSEVTARSNGINTLKEYFKNSCDGVPKNAQGVRPGWETLFRSQGTDIYADGYLEVSLQAPIKQVFKVPVKSKKLLKKEDGQPLLFVLPEHIPGYGVRCGSLDLALQSGKKLQIFPAHFVNAAKEEQQTVVLVFDNKNVVFKTKDPQTEALLENTLAKTKGVEWSSDIVPVAILVKE